MFRKNSQAAADEEAFALLRRAGFRRPTLLQRKVVPLALSGRDLVVQSVSGEGKTASFIIPILARVDTDCPGIKAAILTQNVNGLRKVERQFGRLAARSRSNVRLASLGYEGATRKEVQTLESSPDVIVGTTERVIDHIRRGNLDFSELGLVVVDEPADPAATGFDKDVSYVFSKLPRKRQTIIYSPQIDDGIDHDAITRHAVVLSREQWHDASLDYRYVLVRSARDKHGLLRNLIVSRSMSNCIAYCGSLTKLSSIAKDLRRGGVTCEVYHDGLSIDEKRLVVEHFNSGAVTCILTSSVRAVVRHVKAVDSLVFYDLPRSPGEYVECYSLADTSGGTTPVLTLVTERESPQLRKIEEKMQITMSKDELPTDEQVLEGEINELLRRIKEEENPEELNAIRSVIRKNVSVFNRMYLAAMLMKEHLNRKGTTKGRFTTLFVGVGKNRKVFPKDLSQLFADNASVPRSDIGDIKILDNYSFVEVASKHAKPAIDSLNGMDFRGRKLTVNYARKKEDKKKSSDRKS